MSRVGKKVVAIPAGVTANVDGQTVNVKGPKGAVQLVLHGDVGAKVEAGGIQIDPRNETKLARALWGTSRALVANLMTGVTKGFEGRRGAIGRACRARTCRLLWATATTSFIRFPTASRLRPRSRPRSW